MKFTIIFIVLFLCLMQYHKSDIPTHCLTSQVHGKWIFRSIPTKPYNSLKSLYTLKCGIQSHISVNSIYQQHMADNSFTNSFEVNLNKDMSAVMIQKGKKTVGKWTMVYDEGFEFTFGQKNTPNFSSYFVFLKFQQVENKKYKSKCYESMIGWYHNGSKNWGCFKGHKDVKNYSQITNAEVANKYIVLEGSMEKSFLEENFNIETIFDPTFAPRFMQKEIITENKNSSNDEINSFLETHSNLQSMNQNEMVEKINSMNLSWKAATYNEFEGYSFGQINEFLRSGNSNGKFNFELTKNKKYLNHNNIKIESTDQIDYRKYLGASKSQGRCGSCYATSTLSMLEARFNYKHNSLIKKYFGDKHKSLEFSVEQVMECSWTNQGCKGGYSFLTSKYYNEYGILPSDCYQSGSCHNQCTGRNSYLNKLKFKVKDYYFVGGYYGATTEDNMLEELRKNGPMVVSIKTIPTFYTYSSGIFSHGALKEKGKREWQEVNHSVVLIGYGIENGVEYWNVMNSWSVRWGFYGCAKIKKGDNIMSIESIAEAAEVELIELN